MKRTLAIKAPAKVNLYLAVGGLLSDGYHAVTTVMHSVALFDRLTLIYTSDGRQEGAMPGITVSCEAAPSRNGEEAPAVPDIPMEDNLVYRAAVALSEALGRAECCPDESLAIHVEKHIPAQAGLGGGSSDAASALIALCALWDADPLGEECLLVARALGADVPFFLHGGCALMSGRGDAFEQELPAFEAPVVLLKPPGGISTQEAYRALDESQGWTPKPLEAMTEALRQGDIAAVATALDNSFEAGIADLMSDSANSIADLRETAGVLGALLCGSGSAVFALCETVEDSIRIADEYNARGYLTCATRLHNGTAQAKEF